MTPRPAGASGEPSAGNGTAARRAAHRRLGPFAASGRQAIVEVTTAAERALVCRFRYQVVVCEQGIVGDPAIDHTNRAIVDPADVNGILVAAWMNGELAGTVRLNLLRDGPAVPFCSLLGLDILACSERDRISISSRLAVGVYWRKTPLAIRIAQAVVRYYQAAGLTWNYIMVRPDIQPFWERLGYRRAGTCVDFPGVGGLIPMRLDLDPAYLARVRSVFAPSGRAEPTLRRGAGR